MHGSPPSPHAHLPCSSQPSHPPLPPAPDTPSHTCPALLPAERIEAARGGLRSVKPDCDSINEQLTLGPLLGCGTFGRVYRGYWQGSQVAIKMITLSADSTAGEARLWCDSRPMWLGAMPCTGHTAPVSGTHQVCCMHRESTT